MSGGSESGHAAGYNAAAHVERQPVREAGLSGKRVLVVEDEAFLALEISAMLRDSGMTPIGPTACSGEALGMIETLSIDCALLDVNLRGESTEIIAAALAMRSIPFAFVTGYGRDNLPRGFHDAPLITKPFAEQKLIATVREL
jgi:CheY-like chemotaxis protein